MITCRLLLSSGATVISGNMWRCLKAIFNMGRLALLLRRLIWRSRSVQTSDLYTLSQRYPNRLPSEFPITSRRLTVLDKPRFRRRVGNTNDVSSDITGFGSAFAARILPGFNCSSSCGEIKRGSAFHQHNISGVKKSVPPLPNTRCPTRGQSPVTRHFSP